MADSVRAKALQNLSNALPVANSNVAAGQRAARDMQVQSAVAKAPPTANTTKAAQDTGAAVAQNAGEQMIQSAQQGLQQQGQVAQLGLAQNQQQNQADVASQQAGAKEQAMDNVQRLASIDSKAKAELYDKQMQFAKDENGRTMFNEQQLADYARMNAKSDEELKNYSQVAQQASQRKLQMMETAFKKVQEDMNFKYAEAKQKGDQATMKQIEQDRNDMNARMQRERARAANSAAAWQAGGTVVGAVGGAVLGGPSGASAGAGVGGALGSLAGGM